MTPIPKETAAKVREAANAASLGVAVKEIDILRSDIKSISDRLDKVEESNTCILREVRAIKEATAAAPAPAAARPPHAAWATIMRSPAFWIWTSVATCVVGVVFLVALGADPEAAGSAIGNIIPGGK